MENTGNTSHAAHFVRRPGRKSWSGRVCRAFLAQFDAVTENFKTVIDL